MFGILFFGGLALLCLYDIIYSFRTGKIIAVLKAQPWQLVDKEKDWLFFRFIQYVMTLTALAFLWLLYDDVFVPSDSAAIIHTSLLVFFALVVIPGIIVGLVRRRNKSSQ